MEHWDLLPGVDPKNYCTIVVVCSLVGTFVMFYEEETSPCQVEEDDQTNILQGKLRLQFPGLFNFVAMMTNRARLRHGTPFGADALSGEDIHPFFRTGQADQGHACPTPLVRNWCCKARDWCFPRQENVRHTQKKKQEKEEGKTFRSERTANFGGQRVNDF